jgi:hypothetical protein
MKIFQSASNFALQIFDLLSEQLQILPGLHAPLSRSLESQYPINRPAFMIECVTVCVFGLFEDRLRCIILADKAWEARLEAADDISIVEDGFALRTLLAARRRKPEPIGYR